jgi:hypothetical protein
LTLPFAEAFISPSWLRFDPDGDTIRDSRDNELKFDENALCEELFKLGLRDIANAVQDGFKYHRLNDLVKGFPPRYEGAVGLRLAFNPDAHVPASKEEWVAEALVKYADDEGLRQVISSRRQYLKEHKEEFDAFFMEAWGKPVETYHEGPAELEQEPTSASTTDSVSSTDSDAQRDGNDSTAVDGGRKTNSALICAGNLQGETDIDGPTRPDHRSGVVRGCPGSESDLPARGTLTPR